MFYRVSENSKFEEKSFVWDQVVPCGHTEGMTNGRTDGEVYNHDEASFRLSQFC
jgi:hypothetical protein